METADEFYSYYRELLGDLYDEYDFENLVSVTDENALDMARTLETLGINDSVNYFNLAGDMLFGQFYDETNDEGNVYVYMLSHRTPGRDEDYYWAWHSSELWYTFGSLRDVPEQRDWEVWDYELADLMTSYWANFMRNGDPNGEGLAEWLPSNTQQLAYMEFGEADTTGCVTDMDQLQQLAIEFCRTNYEMFGE